MAVDQEAWKGRAQFRLPSYVRFRSQEFSGSLNDQEKIQFIKNIQTNFEIWQGAPLLKPSPYSFAAFPQPGWQFGSSSEFPINRDHLSPAVLRFIYNDWKNSPLFCQLLPFEKSKRYLDKLFHVEECNEELLRGDSWTHYSMISEGEYERDFDSHLLEAFDASPSRTRANLMSFMMRGWSLWDISDRYKKFYGIIFSQQPLTQDLLAAAKRDRYQKVLEEIRNLGSLNYEEFVEKIGRVHWFGKAQNEVTRFLCQYLHGDCESFLSRMRSEKKPLFEAWAQGLRGGLFSDQAQWVSQHDQGANYVGMKASKGGPIV